MLLGKKELANLEGVDDARELRGNSARLLDSFPRNPGLLYARAYSEVIHPEGDLQDFAANLERSLTWARKEYGVSEREIEGFISRLLASLESESFIGMSLTLDVADRLGLAVETTTHVMDKALRTPGYDPSVRVIALASRMAEVSRELESALGSVKNGR